MLTSRYNPTKLTLNQRVTLWCREGELNPQGAKHRRILSSSRTKIQQLARSATKWDEVLQMPSPARLSSVGIALHRTQ